MIPAVAGPEVMIRPLMFSKHRPALLELLARAMKLSRCGFDEVVMARRLTLETRIKHLRLAADRALAQHEIDYLAGDAR